MTSLLLLIFVITRCDAQVLKLFQKSGKYSCHFSDLSLAMLLTEHASNVLGWTVSLEEGSLGPRGVCRDLEGAVLELDLEESIGFSQ